MTSVERLGRTEVERAVAVLCEAFHGYPAMRFILASSPSAEHRPLHDLMRFFVLARLLRGELVLAIRVCSSEPQPGAEVGDTLSTGPSNMSGVDALAAVALVSEPDRKGVSAELASLRDALWTSLGREARARYERYGSAAQSLIGDAPRLHLNLLGVRPAFRGRGLGSLLIEHVLAVAYERRRGVSLTTEDPRNLAFYGRLGFEVVGEALIAPGLRTWALYRSAGSPERGRDSAA